VVVANAQPELRAWAKDAGPTPRVFVATQRCADGIIEALKHFGFVLSDACADEEADGDA
jgi:hydroxymethylpyrimidine pyrophosphatase-like HAD family hydrolase